MADAKVVIKEKGVCPHCKKKVAITIWKETITKAVSGEYKIVSKLEKDTQTNLKRE